jgi:hypothetical protein
MDRSEMEKYLRARGWTDLWHPDNWIDSYKEYSNKDWAGTSLEKAYQYVKENEHLYDVIDESYEKKTKDS